MKKETTSPNEDGIHYAESTYFETHSRFRRQYLKYVRSLAGLKNWSLRETIEFLLELILKELKSALEEPFQLFS